MTDEQKVAYLARLEREERYQALTPQQRAEQNMKTGRGRDGRTMGCTAAEKDAFGPERAAEIRAGEAKAARERRVKKRAALLKADPTLTFRPTKAEYADRLDDVEALIKSMEKPVTVRQIYYRATVEGLVPKNDHGSEAIGRMVTALREDETIPWNDITDNTRRTILYTMHKNAAEFLRYSVDQFTLDPWHNAKVAVAIWIEKDALAGTLQTITLPLGVPLHVMKGFGGGSFIEKIAAKLIALKPKRPVVMYHLGDFDPSGQYAGEALKKRLEKSLKKGGVKLTFVPLALTPEQIEDWNLPARETKVSDNNLEWFVRKFNTDFGTYYGGDERNETLDRDLMGIDAKHGDSKEERKSALKEKREYLLELSPDSVELDAIEPGQLRSLVRDAIMKHTTKKRIKATETEEELIKDRLSVIADEVEGES
jgi:hypothetical protein